MRANLSLLDLTVLDLVYQNQTDEALSHLNTERGHGSKDFRWEAFEHFFYSIKEDNPDLFTGIFNSRAYQKVALDSQKKTNWGILISFLAKKNYFNIIKKFLEIDARSPTGQKYFKATNDFLNLTNRLAELGQTDLIRFIFDSHPELAADKETLAAASRSGHSDTIVFLLTEETKEFFAEDTKGGLELYLKTPMGGPKDHVIRHFLSLFPEDDFGDVKAFSFKTTVPFLDQNFSLFSEGKKKEIVAMIERNPETFSGDRLFSFDNIKAWKDKSWILAGLGVQSHTGLKTPKLM